MRLFFVLIYTLLFSLAALSQDRFTLSGEIRDSATGEVLIGVSVIAADRQAGVVTNSYGFYSLTLPGGSHRVIFSYLGYDGVERMVEFDHNQLLNIELSPAVINVDGVTVTAASREILNSSGTERLNINVKDVKRLPVIFGETDLLKSIQLLPGISNPAEGSAGINVRGGSMGQNLILLDRAPVYSTSHLLGFFSVFNSDAIKEVTVYKGGVPANFGGRASSVIDIVMKDGNNRQYDVTGGVGLISAKLTVEGPIIREKSSFIISARRTYADAMARLFFADRLVDSDIKLYFYDVNAKINFTLNPKNRFFLSGYSGNDVFEMGSEAGTQWGNTTGTVSWNHIFNNRLYSRLSAIRSLYSYSFIYSLLNMRMRSGIADITLSDDLTWYVNPGFTAKIGAEFTSHRFMPGEITAGDSISFEVAQDEKRALEGALYFQGDQKLSSGFKLSYGLRLSGFTQYGPGWFYTFDNSGNPIDSTWAGSGEPAFPDFRLEPRLAVDYNYDENGGIKLSLTRMSQFIHLLSNTTTGSPTDIWMPSSNNLVPVMIDQASLGFRSDILSSRAEMAVESYYRLIHNTVDYRDGADVIFDKYSESQIVSGMGRGYGLEFFLRKKEGNLTGWISYTVSRTENRIAEINDNSWYPVRYDKTHDVSIVAVYTTGKRITVSATWNYATGNAVTFPAGKYMINDVPVPYYTERNGHRMPDYHRLDLAMTLAGKSQKKFRSDWSFSIYNVYNRHNAYIISFRESETVPGSTEAVKLSLFGIVPSVSWDFNF